LPAWSVAERRTTTHSAAKSAWKSLKFN
jgi:hypothetical protein